VFPRKRKILAQLLSNNSGSGGRSALLDGAPVALPLTHSAIPTRGSLTPSFTRATTETGQKWDDNGYLNFTALAGEIVFKGARRERNWIVAPAENWSSASWVKSNMSVSGTTLTAAAANALIYDTASLPMGVGKTAMGVITLSRVTGTGTVSVSTDGGATYTAVAVSGARVSVTTTGNSNGQFVIKIHTSGDSVVATYPQLNDITGETDQTTIRPYVSVGALIHDSQDPNYLSLTGAGSYVTTADSTANSVVGDIALVTDFAPNTVTGGAEGEVVSKMVAGAGQRSYQLNYSASNGTLLYYWSADGTATTTKTSSAAYTFATQRRYVAVTHDVDNGAAGNDVKFWTSSDGSTWTQLGATATTVGITSIFNGTSALNFGGIGDADTAGKYYCGQIYNGIPPMLGGTGSTTPVVDFNPDRDATTTTGTITSSTTGEVWTLSGASSVVRNAAYHGSMVDGVKCYDTDRLGNPIATTGSYPIVGYVPWEAQTNIARQSNAFTTTWVVANAATGTIVQNAIGPDGATSAWTLTDTDAVSPHGVDISIGVLTAASYTYSVCAKKTSGATTYPVVIAYGGAFLWALATIDTNNGVATLWSAYTGRTIVGTAARCTDFNDDFWRVELVFTGSAISYNIEILEAATATATKSTGTLSEGALTGSAVFYGAMVNLGAFAGPYVPTTTIAVARNANLLTYTGADAANIKTLAATFSRGVGVSSVGVQVALSNGTANTFGAIVNTDATTTQFNGAVGGATQWLQAASSPYTPGVNSKVAWSQATNDIKMDKDGVAQTADAIATLPTSTQINIGHLANTLVFNGPVNHIYGWTRNLSQSELGATDA
jgi:hypothetical protein